LYITTCVCACNWTFGGSGKSIISIVYNCLYLRFLIHIETKYMKQRLPHYSAAALLFTRGNNFTERLLATSSLLSVDTTRQGCPCCERVDEISRARLSSLSGRFIRTFGGERYAERCKNSLAPRLYKRSPHGRAMHRDLYTVRLYTVQLCVCVYIYIYICVEWLRGYAAFPTLSRNEERLRHGRDGERNPLQRDTYALDSVSYGPHAHTYVFTRVYEYISTFLFPWRRIGARYPTENNGAPIATRPLVAFTLCAHTSRYRTFRDAWRYWNLPEKWGGIAPNQRIWRFRSRWYVLWSTHTHKSHIIIQYNGDIECCLTTHKRHT